MSNLKHAAEVEAKCREAFDNYFHKCAASMDYDQWSVAFRVGFRYGRENATDDWADHMARMARSQSK